MKIKSFPTIDLCVNYLVSIGCSWNREKEQILREKHSYTYKNTIVFHDPYNILA